MSSICTDFSQYKIVSSFYYSLDKKTNKHKIRMHVYIFSVSSYRDCVSLCLLNNLTSFVAGFAIFSVLGFMAKEQGVDISMVAQSGRLDQ